MSYNCTISVKNLPGEDICEFLTHLKQETVKNKDSIVENNFIFSPVSEVFDVIEKDTYLDRYETKQRQWTVKIFTHRWGYIKRDHLFFMFGVPEEVRGLFDATYYFQNSCDQDYAYEEWNGIKEFEEVAKSWRNTSTECIIQEYDNIYGSGSWLRDAKGRDEHELNNFIEYNRRSFCYNTVWNRFQKYLYEDENVTYFTLFREYDDLRFIKTFAWDCCLKYNEWVKNCKKELV